MQDIAVSTLQAWQSHPFSSKRGLVAISFDQRNHGTREVNSLANETWRDGNETHAQDMFSIYRCCPDHRDEHCLT